MHVGYFDRRRTDLLIRSYVCVGRFILPLPMTNIVHSTCPAKCRNYGLDATSLPDSKHILRNERNKGNGVLFAKEVEIDDGKPTRPEGRMSTA
jgi:hypothetical protein